MKPIYLLHKTIPTQMIGNFVAKKLET